MNILQKRCYPLAVIRFFDCVSDLFKLKITFHFDRSKPISFRLNIVISFQLSLQVPSDFFPWAYLLKLRKMITLFY